MNRFALWLNFIFALALVAAYGSFYAFAEKYWILSLFGLAYTFLLFINIIFLIYWVVQGKKTFLMSCITIVVGYQSVLDIVQFHFFRNTPNDTSLIKVMSYNVRIFDFFNWTHNKNETRKNIHELIKSESPSIICIQEFLTSDSKGFNNLDTLAKAIAPAKNYYFESALTNSPDRQEGLATFSIFPMVNKGRIDFEKGSMNMCIFTDLKINADTVRIYNVHLQSIHLNHSDYEIISNINLENEDKEVKGFWNIIHRFHTAFAKRATQSNLLAKLIRQSPYPVIVCGDFNDPPSSLSYHLLSQNLADTFVESGYGFGKTYNGDFPSFRIDYILHDKKYRAYGYKTIRKPYSDHYPISCFLQMK